MQRVLGLSLRTLHAMLGKVA